MTTYRRSSGRGKRGSTFALALASSLALAGPAHADVNGFQGGDGDQVADCAIASDWQCLPSEATLMVRDAAGAGDDTFAYGSKEDAPQTWSLTNDGKAPTKADVRAVWTHVSTDAERRTFLDVAFVRAVQSGDNTSDTYLGLELNQSRATWTNAKGASIPCRTDGDVLVSYAVRNPPEIKLYEWEGTGPEACRDGAYGSWNPASTPAAAGEAALNLTRTIDNVLAPETLGTTFAPGRFGEAALDLRGLADAVDYTGTCAYFRTLTVKTRSSAEVSSALQDVVNGFDVMARSCETPGGGTGGTDVTKPEAPSIAAPSAAASACGPDLALSGRAEAGSTVTVYEGIVPKEFAVAGPDGTWSMTIPGVSSGSHSYVAEATDAAGNVSELSAAIAVSVDATAPAAPTMAVEAKEAASVVLGGVAQPGSEVAIARDGVRVASATADADGAYRVSVGVSAGSQVLTATASDACHTGSASAAVTVVGGPGTGETLGSGTPAGDPGAGTGSGTPAGDPGAETTPGTGTTTDTATTGAATPGGTDPADPGITAVDATPAGRLDAFPATIDMAGDVTLAKACALKPFKAYVRMKGVREVRFMVDGRTVKTVRRADGLGQYTATIDPSGLAAGTHKLTARVTFRSRSRKARTLELRFRRCDQCQSRRSFPIRVKNLRNGERAVSAVVYVNGKRAKVVRGTRLRSRVVLAGLPKGSYTVRIVTRTNRGRTSTEIRRYRTCVPKSARS